MSLNRFAIFFLEYKIVIIIQFCLYFCSIKNVIYLFLKRCTLKVKVLT